MDGGSDRLSFANAIVPDEFWFSQNGNDLVISRLGTVDGVTITDGFTSTDRQIKDIAAGDGAVVLYVSEVNSLISQIAAFSAQICRRNISWPEFGVAGVIGHGGKRNLLLDPGGEVFTRHRRVVRYEASRRETPQCG